MKRCLLLIMLVPAYATAAPCAALDYQELKEMSLNDVVTEACKARKSAQDLFQESLSGLGDRFRPASSNSAESESGRCTAQVERLERMIKVRGVDDNLFALCERQRAGEVLQAPPPPAPNSRQPAP